MTQLQTRSAWLVLVALLLFAAHAGANPPQPGDSKYTLELEPFAKHTGTNAMDLTHAPDGSGRVFVSTQSGQVFVCGPDGSERGVYLDLTQAGVGFTFDRETKLPFKGLMYIAFHPDYGKPAAPGFGRFYTGHQVGLSEEQADFDSKDFGGLGEGDKRFMIAEWRVDADNPDRIDPASYRRVMLLNFHTYANNPHALGELAFNPYAEPGEADYGKLYIAVGDSHNGDYSKPTNLIRTQQTDNPFGKILRIDPLASGDRPYAIPDENPFGTEVYAIGLRDPQWFSFAKDLEGETMLVACDIGALQIEEINIIRPGSNYGWDRFEGTLDFDTTRQLQGNARQPVVQYGRFFPKRPGGESTNAGLVAIMGGLVVSDPQDATFQGQILFGDLPSGTLMHANYHHALTVEKTGRQSVPYILAVKLGDKTGNLADVLGKERGDARFGFDEAGSVYIVSKQTDTIFKTKLIYTGLPIQNEPSIARPKMPGWATGLLLTIGATGSCLAVILGLVMLNAKRRRA